eukprot:gene24066-biopygen9807
MGFFSYSDMVPPRVHAYASPYKSNESTRASLGLACSTQCITEPIFKTWVAHVARRTFFWLGYGLSSPSRPRPINFQCLTSKMDMYSTQI